MNKYIVKEYYLNQQPPVEKETIVEADSPIKAIQLIPHWRFASRFTSVESGRNPKTWNNAHTQDGNGRNGCAAKLVEGNCYA